MTEVLSLNNYESKAIYQIQLERFKHNQVIRKEFSDNPEKLKEKQKELGIKVYNQVKNVLGKERQEQRKAYKTKIMKQKITFLLLALFTGMLSVQTVSIQGGSSYTHIYLAIEAANTNDVILITWKYILANGQISISKSITLRGTTGPTVDIIKAAASPASDGLGSRAISLLPAVNTDILNWTYYLEPRDNSMKKLKSHFTLKR